jgi:MoxR-like ATPase
VKLQHVVRQVTVPDAVANYAIALARATRPAANSPDFIKDWVSYGVSVRAAQFLVLGGKARAMLHGRLHVNFDDVVALARPVLRHRILLNFRAQSERVTTDTIIEKLLGAVPRPASGL